MIHVLIVMLNRITKSTTFSISFFYNDTDNPEIYTLSLHDALPIWSSAELIGWTKRTAKSGSAPAVCILAKTRSEEHTSELQSLTNLVCRLLLEKKKKKVMFLDYMTVIVVVIDVQV